MKIKRNQTGSCLLKKIANESDGKIVIASVKPVESDWGHNVSIMPCAETLESAMGAISTLSLERTNIFGVCIHHTDTETALEARKVLKSKKYSTHFLIDKNGETTVELPLDKRAAACVGFNKWTWQVDVVGRLHINKPTKEQLAALENLLRLLSCGRKIETINKKFAAKCKSLDIKEVQIETSKYYQETYDKCRLRAEKNKSWAGVLDRLPFTVFYHGEVRKTACCGKYLISELPEILKHLQEN